MESKLSTLPLSQSLLQHYKQRINLFEEERKDVLLRLERCEETQEERHKTRTEMFRKDQEISELQRALSDAHVVLFDEREKISLLNAEIDRLRIQEIEDRKKIQDLLVISQPIFEDAGYFKDCRPFSTVNSNNNNSNSRHIKNNNNNNNCKSATERVLKTVFLPDDRNNSLLLTIESLKTQLEEQKLLFNQRIEAMMEDRCIRERERENMEAIRISQIEEIQRKNQQLETILRTTNCEYAYLKQYFDASQTEMQEKLSKAEEDSKQMKKEMEEMQKKTAEAISAAEEKSREKMEEIVDRFRDQVVKKDDEVYSIQEKYQKEKLQATKMVEKLDGRLKRLQTQHSKLSSRRLLEIEGYTNDIFTLRRQLKKIESNVMLFATAVGTKDELARIKQKISTIDKHLLILE